MGRLGTHETHFGCGGLSENENRHRPAPFLRGPSEVFRIVEMNHETLPGIDSCFTVANFPSLTLGAVKATVGFLAGGRLAGGPRADAWGCCDSAPIRCRTYGVDYLADADVRNCGWATYSAARTFASRPHPSRRRISPRISGRWTASGSAGRSADTTLTFATRRHDWRLSIPVLASSVREVSGRRDYCSRSFAPGRRARFCRPDPHRSAPARRNLD